MWYIDLGVDQMTTEFFDKLTLDEARIVLRNFLDVEGEAVKEMVAAAAKDGVVADFSLGSLVPVLGWVARHLKELPKQPPEDLPGWIKNEHEKRVGWFEFDEPSKTLLLRAGYYLGETFVRNVKGLTWSTGNPDYIGKNMPVVTGFAGGDQMLVRMVAENMAWRAMKTGSDGRIKSAIEAWLSKAPCIAGIC
ncbi:MAG: hypothetical protein HKL95_08185 [Phycisphaerae bacterium]|nr:hypothetical protein [Phycisphaerae bacterium]